ncbi:MAG: glutamate-1-semialdehyde-2,1-aminomutase [Dehalococcoidia bacterium]|nr:glutamate-1-semialdehyde-2,1-aminomutase [Dehalococcoidia bacterium]MSQ17116.1 glutamate-1-semialdehyde-2,1-aminomutase [Dehalococcoidia bacterium]
MQLPKSERLFAQAQQYIPGGVNSPVRSFRSVGGTPAFIARGQGCRVWDVDGHEYIDYLGSWGPLVLGHAHPAVVAAIQKAAALGTSFGAPVEQEVELARRICQALPAIEKVRLVNSGTEACMSAIRLARAFTGRDKIIKFAGCYHGHADGLLVKAGSGALTHGVPTSAGVPASYASETLVADYNDLASVEALFARYPTEIAGIIVEPVAGNMGVVPPIDDFLPALRRVTRQHDSLLIFDEVITGFRLAWGGAQGLFGIKPDITCLGKIIGGGLPVGAYGGRADIMEQVAPLGPMYQAGTLSGNPLAVSAGLATLAELQVPGVYTRLETLSKRLADGLQKAFAQAKAPCTINRAGSMLTGFFNAGPVQTLAQVEKSDVTRYNRYFHAMLARGVYLAPSQYEAGFVSLAHTETDIDRTIETAAQALRGLR